MKKRIFFIMMAAIAAFSLSACGSKSSSSEQSSTTSAESVATEETSTEEVAKESSSEKDSSTENGQLADPSSVSGGWTNNQLGEAATLPEEVQDAFDKATKDYTESALTPVVYLGSQLVAGNNYEVLCENTQDPEAGADFVVVVIYSDLEGNAKMTGMKDFDYLSIAKAGAESKESSQEVTGGWVINEDLKEITEPEGPLNVFNDAIADYTGNALTPVAYLGNQVVAGQNFAYLCVSQTSTEEPVKSLQVVTVFQDLDQSTEISNVGTVDLGSFTE